MPPEDTQYGFIVELWSAISVSLLLALVAALTWFRVVPWWAALLVGVGGYVLLESAFRRRLTQLTLTLTLSLAVVGAMVLAWEFKVQAILAGLVALALVILSDNVRELLRR